MDIYTKRDNVIRQMAKGYTYAAGHTPDGQSFEIKVRLVNPNANLGRGVVPEKPNLVPKYDVYLGGTKITTLANVEMATALIRNNEWFVE